jgi:hypothetical protein
MKNTDIWTKCLLAQKTWVPCNFATEAQQNGASSLLTLKSDFGDFGIFRMGINRHFCRNCEDIIKSCLILTKKKEQVNRHIYIGIPFLVIKVNS